MKHHEIKQPIFIGGLMKSGTSLLRKLISLHPNIFGGLETHWFTDDFIDHWKDGTSKRQQWLAAFFEVPEEEMESLRKLAKSSFDFFSLFMNYCTQRVGKTRWVEKTPDNVFHTNLIWENWPSAKVLIMERDLRDVFASWKVRKNKSISDFTPIAKKYLKTLDALHAVPEKCLVISYKNLVTNTRETLEALCAFLEESYHEGMENYTGDDRDYNKVLEVTGKSSPTTDSLRKPVFTSSLGQWKTMLNSEEVRIIEQIS